MEQNLNQEVLETPREEETQVTRVETKALSEEKRAQAIELFKHGIGYTKASRILNVSVNTVRDWSRAFKKGRFKVEISENQYRYTDAVRENVIRMRLSGLSWNEIHKRTGISQSTARKWVDVFCRSKGRRRQLLVVGEVGEVGKVGEVGQSTEKTEKKPGG